MANDSTGDTVITFGNQNVLTLKGVTNKLDLQTSDFIFTGQVSVSVDTANGYDFGRLYDELAAAQERHHDASTHFVAVKPESSLGAGDGRIFALTSTTASPFTYDAGDVPTGGTVESITIYDSSYNILVNSNGWNISLPGLLSAIGSYAADQSQTTALDTIFNAARYSIVGSAGLLPNDSSPHFGEDVFFGGNQADVFNGFGGPFGSFDLGNDTVDYSHVAGPTGVTVNLTTSSNSGAAAGDIFLSIENLRGSRFDDSLTGDGNNNVLEGGSGNDTLNGGGGNDTASYEHAGSGVTVSLMLQGISQATGGAGNDTLSNIDNLRGSGFNDTLIGDSNANILTGGIGGDHLTGGLGADTFRYISTLDSQPNASLRDTITDFTHADGDKIDFSGIEGIATQTFQTNSLLTATSPVAANTVAWFQDVANVETVVYVNTTNGSENAGSTNLEIHLTGIQTLTASDFLLHA